MSTDLHGSDPDPSTRRKSAPPGGGASDKWFSELDQYLEPQQEQEEKRLGKQLFKLGLTAGLGALLFTYVKGAAAYAAKDKIRFANTFRLRVAMMPPLTAFYITGAGLVPMPFQAQLEALFGRPARPAANWGQPWAKQKGAPPANGAAADSGGEAWPPPAGR